LEENEDFQRLPKKEVLRLQKKGTKLNKYLRGIKDMNRFPGALFIIDPKRERIAVSEAQKLGIPTVAIVDTNCDPDEIDYVIPGNDDAIRAIRLFAAKVADAAIEGKRLREEELQGETGEEPLTETASDEGVKEEAESEEHEKEEDNDEGEV